MKYSKVSTKYNMYCDDPLINYIIELALVTPEQSRSITKWNQTTNNMFKFS